ncbi:hypothetical protein ACG74X_14200 [Marivita sp. S0852]|uniref:baeRF3 domain-containing protein n=1 Tax=Marivita sp. S0852 TaxID=3373893 RepID=UPI00398297C3
MIDLVQDYKAVLLADHAAPCLSLYQPTHRSYPDRQQDPIRFGNLLKELEQSLTRQYSEQRSSALLRPFRDLKDDAQFWNRTLDGIAVFATETMFKVYNLQRPVRASAIVADSFHTKPLMRILQSADRYHVLGLNRHSATLYEGNRYALDPVELDDGFPKTSSDVTDPYEGDPERTKRAHGPSGPGKTSRHGTDVRQDALRNDTKQFFRAVSDAVLQRYSRPTGIPVLLAALPEHHHLFREVSNNPLLMDKALDVDPGSIALDDLRRRAWEIVLPSYLERLDGLVDQYNACQGRWSKCCGFVRNWQSRRVGSCLDPAA